MQQPLRQKKRPQRSLIVPRNKRSFNYKIAAVGVGFAIVFVDIFLKRIAIQSGGFVPNPYLVFGIGIEGLDLNLLGILMHVLLVFAAVWMSVVEKNSPATSFFILVMAVASLSNLHDRVVSGYVVDYIQFFRFQINLADVAVNIALLCIIVLIIRTNVWKRLKLIKNKMGRD